jgi:uncharacterized protein YjbI with pentapeptide repeats
MVYSDPTVDRIEASFKSLADDVNRTSASTRNGWVFFLALQAYFFIALAGITHRDLLLATPIPLPLLQVPIGLQSFFLFGPAILVLVHMGILLQHVMLARQARELHSRVASFEGRGLYRNHSVRTHLHPYVFTQLLAGPQRSAFFAFFLLLLTWLSLAMLPVFLLLDFQVTFLPYHDLHVTWVQRGILVLDIVMLAVFAVFMRYPALTFTAGFGRTIVERPLSFAVNLLLAGGAVFFALSVATIPGERMDRTMTWLWSADIADARTDRAQLRQAFWPTAFLFEGAVDPLSGRPTSIFGRNLVVTDVDLVKDNAFDEGETSINLRTRDLRYGIFDRTDLHQADLTGANLTQASLREVNLVEAKAEKAIFRGADMWRMQALPSTSPGRPVSGMNLRDADLRKASLVQANLQGAILEGALLEGADFRGAQMDPSAAAEAKRQGANF